jgi:hypothetical protein
MEGLCNQELACLRSVGVSRVDQIDTELDGASQNFASVITIRRPTPNALAGDTHRTKAEPVDRKIAP